jgi:hypothetical protein
MLIDIIVQNFLRTANIQDGEYVTELLKVAQIVLDLLLQARVDA